MQEFSEGVLQKGVPPLVLDIYEGFQDHLEKL
jgi:hypothetical protein